MFLRYTILSYLAIINIITFIVWGIDKWKAINQKWRVKENHLLLLTGLGGWVGAMIAVSVFHHKTMKGKFLWKFFLLTFAWLILSVYLIYLID